jgi:hypothetical protein
MSISERDRNALSASDLAYLGELSPEEFRQMCADANTSNPAPPMPNIDRLASYQVGDTPKRSKTTTWIYPGGGEVSVTPAQRRRLRKHASTEEREANL